VFGIAPKVLRAKGEYTETRTRATFSNDEVGPIPEALGALGDLLKPVRDSVGARLLRRMGWKQGQGVGPRVSSKEKKQQRKDRAVRFYYIN
jgi:G patch domain-containing protein 1